MHVLGNSITSRGEGRKQAHGGQLFPVFFVIAGRESLSDFFDDLCFGFFMKTGRFMSTSLALIPITLLVASSTTSTITLPTANSAAKGPN